MFKKICAVAFAFVMTLSTQMPVFATENSENFDEAILQQALEIDAVIDVEQSEDFQVISMDAGEMTLSSDGESSEEKAIQMVETNNEMVEVTTIVPYKMLPNGELMNSFTYQTRVATESGAPVSEKFVDVTVTTKAFYQQYQHQELSPWFYRHIGVNAYWNSSNSTASVSNMTVWFDSVGKLYRYPDCKYDPEPNQPSSLVQDYYFIRSPIDQDNPVKGQSYSDTGKAMPTNRALRFTDFIDHGGLVYIDLSYSVNGKSYNQGCSHKIYGVQ